MEGEKLKTIIITILKEYFKQVYQGPISYRVVETQFDPKDLYYGYVIILTELVNEVDMNLFEELCSENPYGYFIKSGPPFGENNRSFSLFILK